MTDWDPIQAYLIEFARRLPGKSHRTNRVLDEFEDHLRERADDLRRRGMEPEAAAAAAVERFGTPAEVWRQFELQAPLESEVLAMLRYPLTLIAALTGLAAGLLFIFAWSDDAPPAGTAAKIILAALILGYNSFLLFQIWNRRPGDARMMWSAFGGGLLLIAIGSAGIVWTAHLGLTTGDWENYGFVVGALLVLEGALAAVVVVVGDAQGRHLVA